MNHSHPGRNGHVLGLIQPDHVQRIPEILLDVVLPNGSISHPEHDGFESLTEMALDMQWSWNRSTDVVWQLLNPELWARTRNPWIVLHTTSRQHVDLMLAEPAFRKVVDDVMQGRREAAEVPAWFQRAYPRSPLSCVAYFSMEFMLSEALPIYAGGLGNVAGDQLKAASDLGVPVIGVGLLYQHGGFHQAMDGDGAQQVFYLNNDGEQLPITPLRSADGNPLRIEIEMPGCAVWLRAWKVHVGRATLYLLDSNDAANTPAYRNITGRLHGAGPGAELRLQQQIVLGIGGWRLLTTLGIRPEVCHFNEAHAAFAMLERAHGCMRRTGQPFEVALAITRAGNIFTSHVPIATGFDLFHPDLISKYLDNYARQTLDIPLDHLLALGRTDRDDSAEYFNMSCLAVRGSGAVNAVSRLHEKVSRHLFEPLFPRRPIDEVPVGHITNGVHVPSWISPTAQELWTEACGINCWLGSARKLEDGIRGLSEARLWRFRNESRASLVEFARSESARQIAMQGASANEVDETRHHFDPNVLTLGFARRFATYKRPNLLLQDPERLLRLLTNPLRPVQLILAGKADPADIEGQGLIQKWMHFIQRPEVRPHVIFLTDYDIEMTRHLVQGVDVWLNTPRRPWEACGTSGMKVLANGGLNFSELDGWWAEAYVPDLGWELGDGKVHGMNSDWDRAEAEMLYDVLESEVIPEFYDREHGNGKDGEGIPRAWVARVRESMARLTPRFSASRTVCEYTVQQYVPAAAAYKMRSAENGERGVEIVNWQQTLSQQWSAMRFGAVKVETIGDQHHFKVQICLHSIDPGAVRIELFANADPQSDDVGIVRQEMQPTGHWNGTRGGFAYSASVSAYRPTTDYVPRIVPLCSDVAIPLEDAHILWQR